MVSKQELLKLVRSPEGAFADWVSNVKFWTYTSSSSHRSRTQKHLNLLYQEAGFTRPKHYFWFEEPLHMAVCSNFLAFLSQNGWVNSTDLSMLPNWLKLFIGGHPEDLDLSKEVFDQIVSVVKKILVNKWYVPLSFSHGLTLLRSVDTPSSLFVDLVIEPLKSFSAEVKDASDSLDPAIFFIARDRLSYAASSLFEVSLYSDIVFDIGGFTLITDPPSKHSSKEFLTSIFSKMFYDWTLVPNFGRGHNDLHWVSCYMFLAQQLDIPVPSFLNHLYQIGKSTGWYIPYSDYVFVSERVLPHYDVFSEDV